MRNSARRAEPIPVKSDPKRSTGPWLGRSLVQPAVIGLFHRHGILSGARLSEMLGVGRSSAHLILDRLHRDGCLVVEARKPGERILPGRPTTDYRLNGKHGIYAGVNLTEGGAGVSLLAFDGAVLAPFPFAPTEFGKPGNMLVRSVAAQVKSAVTAAANGPLRHLTVAMPGLLRADANGVVESSPLISETDFPLGAQLAAALDGVETHIIGPAQAGATAESMRDVSSPAPALFVIAQNDFDCPAGYAIAGRSVSGARRRAGGLDSVGRRRAAWLSRIPEAAAMNWNALATRATNAGGDFAAMQRALVEELAEEIAKLASFLDVAHVAVESPHRELIEAILPEVSRLAIATIRVSADQAPSIARAVAGWEAVAQGAAMLPIAAAVTRAIDFEHGAHQPEVSGHIPMVLMDTASA